LEALPVASLIVLADEGDGAVSAFGKFPVFVHLIHIKGVEQLYLLNRVLREPILEVVGKFVKITHCSGRNLVRVVVRPVGEPLHFRISVRSEPLSDKVPPGSHISGDDNFSFHSSGEDTASRLTSLFPRKPPVFEPFHQALVGFPSMLVRLSDNLLSLTITIGGRRDHR